MSEGWGSGKWGQTLFGGAHRQDEGHWVQTGAQGVLSEHEEELLDLESGISHPPVHSSHICPSGRVNTAPI